MSISFSRWISNFMVCFSSSNDQVKNWSFLDHQHTLAWDYLMTPNLHVWNGFCQVILCKFLGFDPLVALLSKSDDLNWKFYFCFISICISHFSYTDRQSHFVVDILCKKNYEKSCFLLKICNSYYVELSMPWSKVRWMGQILHQITTVLLHCCFKKKL